MSTGKRKFDLIAEKQFFQNSLYYLDDEIAVLQTKATAIELANQTKCSIKDAVVQRLRVENEETDELLSEIEEMLTEQMRNFKPPGMSCGDVMCESSKKSHINKRFADGIRMSTTGDPTMSNASTSSIKLAEEHTTSSTAPTSYVPVLNMPKQQELVTKLHTSHTNEQPTASHSNAIQAMTLQDIYVKPRYSTLVQPTGDPVVDKELLQNSLDTLNSDIATLKARAAVIENLKAKAGKRPKKRMRIEEATEEMKESNRDTAALVGTDSKKRKAVTENEIASPSKKFRFVPIVF